MSKRNPSKIRRIKKKEREHGMKYCTFCKPERIDAIYRDSYHNLACADHKDKLKPVMIDTYYTEADYQTWLRL